MLRCGELWCAGIAELCGSEPGYRHPVLVLQRHNVNASPIHQGVVGILTRHMALAQVPGNVLLPKRRMRLCCDSVANTSQIASLNKSALDEQAGDMSVGAWAPCMRAYAGS